MNDTKPIIVWFRQDLRLSDNPALTHASKIGPILPIYILDNTATRQMGAASRWWLHYSLLALQKSLGHPITCFLGDPSEILDQLIKNSEAKGVYWNRCYEPWRIKDDQQIKKNLLNEGIDCQSFNGSLLWEPWQVKKRDGTPYQVFTPFYQHGCLQLPPPRKPFGIPKLTFSSYRIAHSSPQDLNLLPLIPWDKSLEPHWQIGENAAWKKLDDFLAAQLAGYQIERDYPQKNQTSRLSPHLHFGEISPNQVWYAAQNPLFQHENDRIKFLTQIAWREFSYSLLYHHPDLFHRNLQKKFDAFAWKKNSAALKRWQQGQTGFPIVDAGMRELWQTGYMHNRVRMIVGSFLVKNLQLDWRLGEEWFWDCLVDADCANNAASWQWIAGCGTDAAPFFRIFNPVTQGEKFDADGVYTRQYVPELKNLPNAYLFKPWEAPEAVLKNAGVILGEHYPLPLVDIKHSREAALAAYKALPRSE